MKAILVVDMPKSCGQCPCVSFKTDKFECRWRYIDNPDIVQEWCPLKPIPNKACEILVEGLDAMEKMKSVEVRVVRRTE